MHRGVTIKKTEEDAEATREVGMIKHATIGTVRKRNATNAAKGTSSVPLHKEKK